MMQHRAFVFAGVLATIALGCGGPQPRSSTPTRSKATEGEVDQPGTAGTGSVPAQGGGTTSGGACGPTGDRYLPSSQQALEAAVRGTWLLCSPVGLFRRPQDGIFISPDDKYVLLARDGD